MKKQEQRQKQISASALALLPSALALLLLGIMAMASPGAAAKSNKIHRVHRHTQRPIHHAARSGVLSLSAGQTAHTIASPGAAGGPLRFTPQQWQDYGEMMRRESSSGDLVKQGDADAELHNWSRAAASYQDALNLWPNNPDGLYGMGQCAAAAGDLTRAISYYRLAVYTKAPGYSGMVPGSGFQTNDVERLMQFALLLNKASQVPEALLIYNRAAALMDYERGDVQHGDQNVKVLLPGLALVPAASNLSSPNLVQYTSDRLQALADTALARHEFDYKAERAYIQEAVKLYPDSAVIQYYLGEALAHSYYFTLKHPIKDKEGMAAAYQKAVELGDDKTAAAAKERMDQFR